MLHSPSSVSLAMRCRRAWWLRYREKIRPPELTWKQVCRMQRLGMPLPLGARSKALGTEMHRLAEIYLAVAPEAARKLIDWNDLPGQCLAELVPHLPPAGSVPRANLERRVTVKVAGVQFQGLIDLLVEVGASAVTESYDHKSTGDIRTYALLPDAVAKRFKQPKRSLLNDLQACLYVLARARDKSRKQPALGGLCRWNYSETKRSRRSLPVLQYVPTTHARTIVERAATAAREVERYERIEDATPDTTACGEYGGCWYRAEGHCKVPRRWGLVINKFERDEREAEERKRIMGRAQPTLNEVRKATAKSNEEELRKVAKAKAKAAPVEEDEDEDTEEEDDEDDAPESEPAPRAAKKKTKPAPVEVEDEEDDEEDAPESEPPPAKAKSARAEAKEAFTSAIDGPDHIIQFFDPGQFPKGEARTIATGFAELAAGVAESPRNPERAASLRLLLQARDCAVRAVTGAA